MSPVRSGPLESIRLPAAGVTLHAMQSGTGAPPILLLHGFPDHWRTWHLLMPLLAARRRVLAPDLRGANLSDKPPNDADYAIDRLVEDVTALIDALGGRVVLVGNDWGGMLAWVVAARHPERVSHLVILNAPHPCRLAEQLRDDPAQRAASAYLQNLTAPDAVARFSADECARPWAILKGSLPFLTETERELHVAAWMQPGALRAQLSWYRQLPIAEALAPGGVRAFPDLGNASGHIDAPTLVVWGERDGSFPVACLDGLEQWVPQLSVLRIPDLGHWPHLEAPARVANAILSFLSTKKEH